MALQPGKISPELVWSVVITYGPAEIYKSRAGEVGWAYQKANHMASIHKQEGVFVDSVSDEQIALMLYQIDNHGKSPETPQVMASVARGKKDLITLIKAALQSEESN